MKRLDAAISAAFTAVDWLAAILGVVAAWLFVAAGAMLVYEVVARYIFVAPTIWAAELALQCLIWGSFLAAAALLKQREHITITFLTERLPPVARRMMAAVSLIIILALCSVAVWYGIDIAGDSIGRGRTTGSMLNLPAWIAEASVPAGFTLIGLQALVELARLITGRASVAGVPTRP